MWECEASLVMRVVDTWGELPDMRRCSKSEASFLHLALKTLMVGSVSSISASEGMIVLRRAGAEVGVDGKLTAVAGAASWTPTNA